MTTRTRISLLFCALFLTIQGQAQFTAGNANFTSVMARSIEADQDQFNSQPPNADIQELRVDLNNDGAADLSFKTLILQNSPQNWQHTISCDILQNPNTKVSVCANTWPVNYASFYQTGDVIDPQCNGAGVRNFLLSRYGSNGALPFTPLDVDTTYIGFQFIENGDTTQGWLEVGLHNAAVTRFELHRIGSEDMLNSQSVITNTEEAAIAPAFRLLPNPAQSRLRIQLSNVAMADYRILDLTGRLVQQGYLNSEETSLDIAALHSGLYVVQVISEAGMFTRRLRVQ